MITSKKRHILTFLQGNDINHNIRALEMRSSYWKTLHGIISSKILYCGTAVITIYRSLFAFLPLQLSTFSLPLLSYVAYWTYHRIEGGARIENLF